MNPLKDNLLFKRNIEWKPFRDLEIFTTNRTSSDLWLLRKIYKSNSKNLPLNSLKMTRSLDQPFLLKTNIPSNTHSQFLLKIRDLSPLLPKSDMMFLFSTINMSPFNKRIVNLVVDAMERSPFKTLPTCINMERRNLKINMIKKNPLTTGLMLFRNSV